MHMLQQNWYNDGNRYFKWILDNAKKVFITYDLLFILFLLLKKVTYNKSLIIFGVFYIIVYFLYKSKIKKEQSKKPLVITARIKRLYVTMLLLYIITILPMYLCFNSCELYKYYTYIGLIVYLNPFFVLLANIINKAKKYRLSQGLKPYGRRFIFSCEISCAFSVKKSLNNFENASSSWVNVC